MGATYTRPQQSVPVCRRPFQRLRTRSCFLGQKCWHTFCPGLRVVILWWPPGSLKCGRKKSTTWVVRCPPLPQSPRRRGPGRPPSVLPNPGPARHKPPCPGRHGGSPYHPVTARIRSWFGRAPRSLSAACSGCGRHLMALGAPSGSMQLPAAASRRCRAGEPPVLDSPRQIVTGG